MYKVLLVDDETIFLQYLCSVIPWEQYGCSICGCARSGEQALEMIMLNPPDLVFLDINMSNMNGLTLCDLLKQRGIGVKIIIMTAHNEFSFAHKAIKLDVFDYLLKPFDDEELCTTLTNCLEEIRNEQAVKKLRTYRDKHAAEQFFLGILNGVSGLRIEDYLDAGEASSYLVGLLKFQSDGLSAEMCVRDWMELHLDSVYRIRSFSLGLNQGEIVFLHMVDDSLLKLDLFTQVYQELLEQDARDKLNCCALGSLVDDYRHLHSSFEHARVAMENIIKVDGRLVCYDMIQSLACDSWNYSLGDVKLMIRYFEAADYTNIEQMIEKMFGLEQDTVFSFQYVISVYHSLSMNIYSHYYHGSSIQMADFNRRQAGIFQELSDCRTADQVLAVIKNYIYEVFSDCINYQPTNKKEQLIAHIEAYLQENYGSSDLNVTAIANALFFESSYIRRIYKEHTGKTIMQRLEQIRIEQAKFLLQTAQCRHSDIARQVGYADPLYFSKRFKQICGITPTDFEASCLQTN